MCQKMCQIAFLNLTRVSNKTAGTSKNLDTFNNEKSSVFNRLDKSRPRQETLSGPLVEHRGFEVLIIYCGINGSGPYVRKNVIIVFAKSRDFYCQFSQQNSIKHLAGTQATQEVGRCSRYRYPETQPPRPHSEFLGRTVKIIISDYQVQCEDKTVIEKL